MSIEIVRSRVVIDRLSRDEISLENISAYMLVNILIGYVFGYSTLVFSTAGTGWLGWLELICVLSITTIGFINCSSRDEIENKYFIYDFICLSVPIGFTTVFLSWSLYWFVWWVFEKIVLKININDNSHADMLIWIAKDGPTYSVFLTNVLSNIFYFKRMKNALFKVRYIRKNL